MNSSSFAFSVGTYVPMLRALSALLDKAVAQAGNAAGQLVEARIAPDMYSLAQQVQQACHYAANDASRLTGREARPVPPVRSSIEQLQRGSKTQLTSCLRLRKRNLLKPRTVIAASRFRTTWNFGWTDRGSCALGRCRTSTSTW